jgi:hypothetical protein
MGWKFDVFKAVTESVITTVSVITTLGGSRGVHYMMKQDGSWDKRFKGGESHPTRKDGKLDMRYKENWGIKK